MLIKLTGKATASRQRTIYRASEKCGKLARFVDLIERGDKDDSDLDHCSSWNKVNPACAAWIAYLAAAGRPKVHIASLFQ